MYEFQMLHNEHADFKVRAFYLIDGPLSERERGWVYVWLLCRILSITNGNPDWAIVLKGGLVPDG